MKLKAKAPQEDPQLKATRERAEKVAEQQAISETQKLLEEETASFGRRFGARAAVGGLGGSGRGSTLFKQGVGGSPSSFKLGR